MKTVVLEVEDRVGKITLKKPPLNILDTKMLLELRDSIKDAKSKNLHALVISGEKNFSAGADVKDHLPEKVQEFMKAFTLVFEELWSFETPTVAVVTGYALGGGCELALSCDVVIAEENSKFGQPEIKVGVFPPIAVLLFKQKRALEMILTGETITARDAFEIGLVNKVVASKNLEKVVNNYLEKFRSLSSVTLKFTKMALRKDSLKEINKVYEKLMETEDAVEGLVAFLEKRKPRWS